MKKINWLTILCLGILVVSVTGITDAFSADIKVDKSKWPKSLYVSSGTTGGIYQVLSGPVLKIIEELGISATTGTTGGPIPNVMLTDRRKAGFSFTTLEAIKALWEGRGLAKGKLHRNVRVVVPMFVAYLQFVVMPGSNIQKVQDLNGKVVSLGARGSGSDQNGRVYLEVAGIKPSRIINASFSDTHNMMRDGLVEAMSCLCAIKHPAIMEPLTTMDARIIGLDSKDIPEHIEKLPGLVPGSIPANSYKDQPQVLHSVKSWSVLITNDQIPEDLVYEVAKKMYERKDLLVTTHSAMKAMTLEVASEVMCPYHVGAYKFFQDQGIKILPEAKPPEMK